MKETIQIKDLHVEYDDIRRGRVVQWGHGAGVYLPKTWLHETVVIVRLNNRKEAARMNKPKLTEEDKVVIDEAVEYMLEGMADDTDPEFERLVDRLCSLNRKLSKL